MIGAALATLVLNATPEPVRAADAEDGAAPGLYPAPELFEATGTAVWTGGRTLQGIWVAHPLAETARRVRIVNQASGRSADGAVLRLDAQADGESMKISAEAARLIGLAPGQASEVLIVALTPVPPSARPGPAAGESAPGAETVVASRPGTELTAPPAAAPERRAEPVALSAMVQAAAHRGRTDPAGRRGKVEPHLVTASAPTSDGPLDGSEAGAAPAAPGLVPLGRTAAEPQAGARMQRAIRLPATPPAGKPDPGPDSPRTDPERGAKASVETAAPAPVPQSAALPAEPAASTPPSGAAPAATPGVPPGDRTAALQAGPAPGPLAAIRAPESAGRAAAGGHAAPLPRPYVQAGIFAVPGNASRLIGRLRAADLPAAGKPIRVGGRAMTRVVAGPFETSDARDAALRAVRRMGLHDALAVAR